LIREEYALTSWRGWHVLIAAAIRGFRAHNGTAPDLLVVNKAMHRRLSVAACAKEKRYAPIRGLGIAGGVVAVVVEDDMSDNAFALIGAERDSAPRAA
jgi:hypothetical protein